MGESMRVRKSKNRGVLKDSETVILGFYKTMDYDTLMLWYDEVFESKCYYICSCFEYVFVCYQHLYLLTVLESCFSFFSLLPLFIPPNRTRGPQDQEKAYLEPKKNPGNIRTCKSVFQECLCPPETYLFSSIITVRTVPEPMFPKHLALLLLFCIPLGGCHGVESSQTGLVVIR